MYVCVCMYACMYIYVYRCIFKVRFSFQVFDLICTSFAILGLFSQHFLNFTIFLKLGTGLRSITGNPQKIWSRKFAKKSIIGSYQESQSMRGMVTSRTLVEKRDLVPPSPLGMIRVKELDYNLNLAMYLLMFKKFIFFSYQTIVIKQFAFLQGCRQNNEKYLFLTCHLHYFLCLPQTLLINWYNIIFHCFALDAC